MDIELLSIEMVKIKHGYSREIVTNIFTQDTHTSQTSGKIEIVGYLL